jgi:hypothetical protein
VRATTLDDMTITFGSIVQFPDPLHGGAYPSVTVYDYRHDEDRVRLQLNDTGVLYMYLPYDTRDPQIQKYLTSIGSNGVYYTRRSSNVELALDLFRTTESPACRLGQRRRQRCSSSPRMQHERLTRPLSLCTMPP